MSLVKIDQDKLDNILELWKNKTAITDEAILLRLDMIDYADNQIRLLPKQSLAISALVNKYKISKYKALEIIREAQYIHGSQSSWNKEYYRTIVLEKLFTKLEVADRANRLKDFANIMSLIIKLLKLDSDDDNTITADMLRKHSNIFSINLNNNTFNIDSTVLEKLSKEDKKKISAAFIEESLDFDIVELIEKENE